MNCGEFETRLNDLLDERVSPANDEQLDAHASQCPACRETLVAVGALREGLDLMDHPDFASDFSRRIVGLVASPAPRVSRTTAAISVFAVVAAVLLVAMIPSVAAFLKPTDPIAADSNNDAPDEPKIPAPVPETPKVVHQDSSSDDVNDTVAHNNVQPQSVPSFGAAISLPDLRAFSDMSQQIDSDRIPGFRPIRSSFGVAIRLLRQALPGGQKPSPEKPQAGQSSLDVQNLT